MLINRIILQSIKKEISPGKVVVIYGPRQVGKTTLVQTITKQLPQYSPLLTNGDELKYKEPLASQDASTLKNLIGKHNLLIIDEAQKINHIGTSLKIITDYIKNVAVLITGSASLELANQVNEPLTGRKTVFTLYPLSYLELKNHLGKFEADHQLHHQLIYGSYPKIITSETNQDKQDCLSEITSSYLYKDILELEGVRKSEKILKLLRLLAFQVGHNVSISELASNTDMDTRTVDKYLNLLEKTFVIYYLGGFSRNLRKEIAKTGRYYFFDNGVRNALINNFNPVNLRQDIGQLWENYLMIERLKFLHYQSISSNHYFWRTYDQQEIDLIEESQGHLTGYEFKWRLPKNLKPPSSWKKHYPNSNYQVIAQSNYHQFIS